MCIANNAALQGRRPPGLLSGAARGQATQTRWQARTAGRRCLRVRVAAAYAVGIDLGTSNSAVAIIDPAHGAASIVTTDGPPGGPFTVPSVVAYAADGRVLVGHEALQAGAPATAFSSVKRLMGRSAADAAAQLGAACPAGLVAGPQGEALLDYPALGRALAPEEVSAHLLRALVGMAAARLGCEPAAVCRAVITVPARCSPAQRAATERAAQLAGLQHVVLLQEPVAAAVAFGFGRATDADTLLVFDLGGGTLDVSVVDAFEGIMEVLASAGNPHLGGDDFDAAIAEALLAAAQQPHPQGGNGAASGSSTAEAGVQCPRLAALRAADPAAHAALLAAARHAKVALSGCDEAGVELQGGSGGPAPLAAVHGLRLTRGAMEQAVWPLAARLWAPVRGAAEEAKAALAVAGPPPPAAACTAPGSWQDAWPSASATEADVGSGSQQQQPSPGADRFAPKARQLTAALLVGGATRMPLVRRYVRAVSGLEPRSELDPEAAVALGAALHAGVLLGLVGGGEGGGAAELMDGGYDVGAHGRTSGFPTDTAPAWQEQGG